MRARLNLMIVSVLIVWLLVGTGVQGRLRIVSLGTSTSITAAPSEPYWTAFDGVYLLERTPSFFWMNDETFKIAVVNPTTMNYEIELSVQIGPDPCGREIKIVRWSWLGINSLPGSSESIRSLRVNAALPNSTSLTLKVTTTGKRCRIENDPREFFGALEAVNFVSQSL